MTSSIETVAWSRPPAERPGTVLVVALHGRGSDESSMIGLSSYLPDDVTIAAPRGPVDLGGGSTWFENRGIGRPVEASIRATAEAFFAWLDDASKVHSAVVILGFSGGTAMAGGLILDRPSRFTGAVLLSGTLPWDAGYNTSEGRLAGLPLFWSVDPDDGVIPRELVERSESWLRESSGADLREHRYPAVGHSISIEELNDVKTFINEVGAATR
jgi:phospholipase/carboxylesterase